MTENELFRHIYNLVMNTDVTYKQVDSDMDEEGDVTIFFSGLKVEGDENDYKIIKMALSSDDNENAFQQDIGLGASMVFDLNDQALRAKIRRRLLQIFEDFQRQKRYKLVKESIKWGENTEEQELELTFKYINMESDEEKQFRRVFSAQE